MKDKQFDHIISSKISSLRANPNLADWEQLKAKIELDLQSDVQFDSSISDKVSQLTMGPTASTPDWESFSQKLNQTVEFDATIKQKLNHISATKVSEHWLILQERLQGIRDLKRSILRIKLCESLFMVSLLFCLISLSEYVLPSYNDSIPQLAISSDKTDRGFDKATNVSFAESIAQPNVNINRGNGSNVRSQNRSNLILAQGTSSINEKNDERVIESSLSTQTIRRTDSVAKSTPTVINRVGEDLNSSEQSDGNYFSQDQTLIGQSRIATSTSIPALPSKLNNTKVSIQGMTLTPNNGILALTKKVSNRALGRFAIHTLIGVGVDQITTPEDETFDLSGYQHYAASSDVGLRVSYDMDKWSIETGISILHKGYKPKYLQEVIRVENEAVEVSLESIDLAIVSVPFTLKRSIQLDNNLSLFGLAGVEYLKLSTETHDISRDNTEFPEIGKDLGVVSELEKRVSEKINNQSMNYAFGLGLAKSINPLVDVYGQALYRGQFSSSNGLGINQDRFNSLAIQAGIKLRLAENN